MEELIILPQREFQVLAAAWGIGEIFGVCPREDMSGLGRSDLLYIVHEMAQKNILKFDGARYEVQEPYRSVLCSIREAEQILAVEDRDGYASVFYFGRALVCLEESVQDEDAVRIGIYDPGKCRSVLEEKGFLPQPCPEGNLAVLQTEDEAGEWLANVSAGGSVPYVFRYRIFDSLKSLQAEYDLVEGPFNDWIVHKSGEELQISRYDGQRLYEKLVIK